MASYHLHSEYTSMRKGRKLLAEKRRRGRINQCLGEIKEIVCQSTQCNDPNYEKMEKAEILETTVDYLRNVRKITRTQQETKEIIQTRFHQGFSKCAEEMLSYIQSVPGVSDNVQRQLRKHLSRRLSSHVQQEPVTSPSRQSTSPSYQSMSPLRQSTSPSYQSMSPSRQSTSPSYQSMSSPSRQSTAPSYQSMSPSRQSMSPSRQSMSPSRQSMSPSRQSTAPRRLSSPHQSPNRQRSEVEASAHGTNGLDASMNSIVRSPAAVLDSNNNDSGHRSSPEISRYFSLSGRSAGCVSDSELHMAEHRMATSDVDHSRVREWLRSSWSYAQQVKDGTNFPVETMVKVKSEEHMCSTVP